MFAQLGGRAKNGQPFLFYELVHKTATRGTTESEHTKNIFFVAGQCDGIPGGAGTLTIVHGPHRCAEADLVVLNDHAVLHVDSQTLAKSEDLTLALLYITLRGLDVVTKAQVMAATGAVCRIQQCMRHARRCSDGKIVLLVRTSLAESHPFEHRALRKVSAEPGAKFQWCKTDREVSGVTETSLATLEDVILWAQAARRIDRAQGVKAMSVQGVLLHKT